MKNHKTIWILNDAEYGDMILFSSKRKLVKFCIEYKITYKDKIVSNDIDQYDVVKYGSVDYRVRKGTLL